MNGRYAENGAQLENGYTVTEAGCEFVAESPRLEVANGIGGRGRTVHLQRCERGWPRLMYQLIKWALERREKGGTTAGATPRRSAAA